MEVVGINAKLSGPGRTALIVRPGLTPAIFAEIQKLSVTPLLSALSFQNIDDCLVFYCSGFSELIRTNIIEILNRAEENAYELQRKSSAST
jgi:hypothetical protein